MNDAEQIARLRVATATGQLPRDLGDWALARILRSRAATERRAYRNALIRAAADRIGGSIYARAAAIVELTERFDSLPGLLVAGWFPIGTTEALMQSALRLHPDLPRTRRQLLRILASSDISGA